MSGIKKLIENLVQSNLFNNFIVWVIVVNAVIIGLETYPELAAFNSIFVLINDLALAIFIIEIILRISAVFPKIKTYFLDKWNFFDFIIVVIALIPAIGPIASIARITRLFRTFRLFTRFKDLRLLILSLAKSIPSVMSLLVLMFILIYIYGVIGYHFFHEIDPPRWGSLGKSMLTLFTMLTLEGWDKILYTALEVNSLAWIYFVSYIIVGALMIVNLFMGIMVSHVIQIKEKESVDYVMDVKLINEIRETKQLVKNLQAKLEKKTK
ncbi:MAG: ion transporter [Candidatus Diapherotrites archaeon]|nr:ion transporter [Candidatus Diapherotrites archaeon]